MNPMGEIIAFAWNSYVSKEEKDVHYVATGFFINLQWMNGDVISSMWRITLNIVPLLTGKHVC